MKKDIYSTSAFRLILILLSVVQGIIIARYLLPEGKGLIALYVTGYNISMAIGNLGVRQSSSYYLSKQGFSVEQIISVQSWLICMSILFEWVILLVIFWTQDLLDWSILSLIFFSVICKMYSQYTLSFAFSNRWIRKINISEFIGAFINFLGVVILIMILGGGVRSFFIGLFLGSLLNAYYNYSWASKIEGYRLLYFKRFRSIQTDMKKVLFKGITYALPLFIFGLNYQVDLFILNKLTDEHSVGLYSQGASLAQMVWFIPQVLQLVIFSYSLTSVNEKSFSVDLWKKTIKMMKYGFLALFVIVPAGYFLIPIVYGPLFQASSMVFCLIIPGVFLMIFFKVLNGDLAAQGKPEIAMYIFAIAVVINIALNFLLIPSYYINGAAIASCISYAFAAIVFTIYYYRNMMQLSYENS